MHSFRILLVVSLAAVGVAPSGFARPAPQRYTPVPGGFAIRNGQAEFTRPLYGWHGDDDYRRPRKTIPFTGDRPKVRCSVFRGMQVSPVKGVLSFGDGTETIESRYVWGRAEYDLAGKGTVKMVRSASSDRLLVETAGDLPPKFDGVWTLDAQGESGGRRYYAFGRAGMKTAPVADPVRDFIAATDRVERIARTIEIRTPDPLIDSLLACQLVAADAVIEGPTISCGVTNWRVPYGGWRQAYVVLATGWNDAFRAHARLFFNAQRKDGRIPSKCTGDEMYNMNEVFVDSVLRYWRWSGDDAFMREIAYEGVKRHLDWMGRTMKVPGADIYENWLNAWNTDNKWCNGGGGTIASAYVAYAYRTMAEVAHRLGRPEDAKRFDAHATAVARAIQARLWDEEAGVWGEYRERFGLGRLMRNPDTSAVYTAIDSLPSDLGRFRRAVGWIERNTPSHFTDDGTIFLYSSNKLPKFYSSCGLYQQENFHWALACYQAGEPELGWRNLHAACEVSARGTTCGPGAVFYDLDDDLRAPYGTDLSDSVGIFLRTVVEGVFGIVDGRTITPSFPVTWDRAEIRSPYVSYVWTRRNGVKVTARRTDAPVEVLPEIRPSFVGAAAIPPHRNWGAAKGEGTDCTVPAGTRATPVDLSGAFNQEWRLLHARTYSPRLANFPWSRNVPRTMAANGRTWWEWHEVCCNRRWPGNYCVPDKLDWPQDGVLRTAYGPEFRMGPVVGANAAFTSFYDQFPKEISVPLSGKARKLALLTALSTNPNIAWMEAAAVTVEYADGGTASLSLVPPDNCDDWLGYSWGHWAWANSATDGKAYAVKGNPVKFAPRAHANVLAIDLDPNRELSRLRLACRGTETLAGLLAATLYGNDGMPGEADRAISAVVTDELSRRVLPVSAAKSSYRVALAEIDRADRACDDAWRNLRTEDEFLAYGRTMREKFIASMGGFPKERCPLNAQTVATVSRDGYKVEKILFESWPGVHVTANLFLPDDPKYKPPYPAILLPCGHSSNGKGSADYQRGCVLAARAGMACLIYDPFCQGERSQRTDRNRIESCGGHNRIGSLAALLGFSMARYRLWDGMRALDYLETRPEIDRSRLGCMGNSGGGTMSSLFTALEPRLAATCPSCYISTYRIVAESIGPGDAEQNHFAQFPMGINNASFILMSAPRAVRLQFCHGDFFPFKGSLETFALIHETASKFGWAGRYAMTDVDGPHGWKESTRTSSVEWMRYWLCDDKAAFRHDLEGYRALDRTWRVKKSDIGLANGKELVAPKGWVRNLTGERRIYDVLRDELRAAETARKGRPTATELRELAGIRDTVLVRTELSWAETGDVTVVRMAFRRANGLDLPAMAFVPRAARGVPVLVVGNGPMKARSAQVRQALAAERPVLVADLTATGEIGGMQHSFYRCGIPEEEVAIYLYTLGRSLVGEQAGEILALARVLKEKFGKPADVIALERTGIAAVHARAVGPESVGHVDLLKPPPSWTDDVRRELYVPFASVVNGALRHYDWTDLRN